MTSLGDFHFIRPAWLLLVPFVIGVWWLVRRSQDPLRGWRAAMDSDLLAALTVGQDTGGRWRGSAILAAWLIAVAAIAGPTWRPEPSPFADDPVPVMLVLKAGETMDLTDLIPSRMERARLKAADFAKHRKGQPLGLIAYSGTAHPVLPPTRDTAVVGTMATEISPNIMPKPGDDLAAALELAQRTLAESGGSIVVLADTVSETNDSQLAQFRDQGDVPVFVLAIAHHQTPEWEAIQRAASTLGAKFISMTADSKDVLSLVKSTAKAPVAVSAAGEGTRWAESGWLLVPVLVLLSLAGFRRVTRSATEEEAA